MEENREYPHGYTIESTKLASLVYIAMIGHSVLIKADGEVIGHRRGYRKNGGPCGSGGEGGRFFGRGDVKFALLELLRERPMHGYEMMKALEEKSGGFYRPSPGSVYPTLQMLEDGGLVTSNEVEGKKVYSIT